MSDRPKVSILMPSLNVGSYIRECIESVVKQTLRDIEIICIDAGSTDGTLEVLQEYAAADSRIKLLISDKKSYGYQMNLGLDAAQGEFIGIVETDDWADPEMFAALYQAACRYGADMVKANYYRCTTQNGICSAEFENLADCRYNHVFEPSCDKAIFTTTPAIWSGIYRSDMLRDNGVRFHESPGASYQDASFHFMVCTVSRRCVLLREPYLHYRIDNSGSSVHASGKVFCVSDELHFYENFLASRPDRQAVLREFVQGLKFEKYRWNYERLAPENQWEFLLLAYDEFRKASEEGLLHSENFTEKNWKSVCELLENPLRFFKMTCKKYSTRPRLETTFPCEILTRSQLAEPKVSVIIPAYNDEKYIEDALQSVLSQTLADIEIICINDGSTDATLSRLRAIAQKNHNITLITQCNKGLSVARNVGMKEAKGKYIHFLDSDDMIESTAYETLYSFAEQNELDVLYFSGKPLYETEALMKQFPYYKDSYEYNANIPACIPGKDLFTRMRRDNKYRTSVCVSFYNRNYIGKIRERFEEGILHEDNLFSFRSIMLAQRVSYINVPLYVRRVRQGSIMSAEKTFEHVYGYLMTLMRYHDFLEKNPISGDCLTQIHAEITTLESLLRTCYQKNGDVAGLRSKFTAEELFALDTIIEKYEYKVLKNRSVPIKHSNQDTGRNEADLIRQSWTYKIGRFVTWLPRKIRGGLRCYREHGMRYTVRRFGWHVKNAFSFSGKEVSRTSVKPLFVSSDAYKGSGAFLSLIALNKVLNEKFHVHTKVVFPYRGSGQAMIEEYKTDHCIIPSSDWIVPIDHTDTGKSRYEQYKKHTDNMLAALKIAVVARKGDFNLIHSNTSYTYVGALASKISGLPHVWHIRELLEEDQQKKIRDRDYGYKLMAESDKVIAISQTVYDKYSRVVSRDRIHKVYNGVRVDKFYSPDKTIFTGDKPTFLFVSGSDSPLKGRADLVEACGILSRRGIDFDLWFVGWCGEELCQSVENQGIASKTTFWGYQPNPEEFYKKTDITFICSRNEAFGRTTVEAMMAGSLVIGADTAATKELIDEGKTGLLYIHCNPNNLADKIMYALAKQDEMKVIADAGRKQAAQAFTAEKNAESILAVYNSISLQNPGACKKFAQHLRELCFGLRWLVRKSVLCPVYRLVTSGEDKAVNQTEQNAPELPAVSVIIPIYNGEDYLEQCLGSVMNQSLKNIEIICVNDGSTDRTSEMLQKYSRMDERIVVIDKINSGYGASMNMGLAKARGRYIGIVESDDFIDIDMFAQLYKLAEQHPGVDIVKSSYWNYFDADETSPERILRAPISDACHPPKGAFSVWEYPEIIYHHPSIWSCIYRRGFLASNDINFVEAKGGGWVDNPFLIESFCLAKQVVWTKNAYYFYRQTNLNSSSFIKDCALPFRRTKEMFEFLERNNITDSRILGSVYKRVLYNADLALHNPHYDSEKDDGIIMSELERVDPAFLNESRVKQSERDAYHYFMSRKDCFVQ